VIRSKPALLLYEEAFRDIRGLYRGGVSATGWEGCVRKEDVIRWSEVSGLNLTQTFDRLGVELSRDYAAGILTWEFCDAIANDLFAVLIDLRLDDAHEVDEPKRFWKFYLAFDVSETVPAAKSEQVAREEIAHFLASLPANA